jgi:thiamine-monophosphate kinase
VIRMPLSERKLIERIRRSARGGEAVVTGIGDDCAVLRIPSGHEMLVTTDFSIENVHFQRDWHPPELVGWRCLTRGLSDIAAMGGEPLAAFLSLAVASDVPQQWVSRFLKGLLKLAKEFNVPLAGGDTAQSTEGIQADIVVIGSVPKGKAILRSGAKPGDQIYVTGKLGAASAILKNLQQSELIKSKRSRAKRVPVPIIRQLRPLPRLEIGQWLRERGMASAMIDLSDGLSTDLDHLCEESRVGAEIEAETIPRAHVGSAKDGSAKNPVALEFALHGGDDYELLFTSTDEVPSKVAGVQVTRIGRITKVLGIRLLSDGKAQRLKARGWEHFTKQE